MQAEKSQVPLLSKQPFPTNPQVLNPICCELGDREGLRVCDQGPEGDMTAVAYHYVDGVRASSEPLDENFGLCGVDDVASSRDGLGVFRKLSIDEDVEVAGLTLLSVWRLYDREALGLDLKREVFPGCDRGRDGDRDRWAFQGDCQSVGGGIEPDVVVIGKRNRERVLARVKAGDGDEQGV